MRVQDRFGRDITHSGMPILDWEGFMENPQFRFSSVPPANVTYPVTFRITAAGSPRLYLFQRQRDEHPYDIRDYMSVHNEEGPLWGVTLTTVGDELEVFGGVAHDLTDTQLEQMGLSRGSRNFFEDNFPLELHLGIHPDRDGDDELHNLMIEMTDSRNTVYRQEMPVSVCDQDRPERTTEFKFHIDYSTDWFNYLEGTEDGTVVRESAERILDDIAYFFEDMRFDTVEAGECETFVNWTVEERSGFATNGYAYDSGHYLFINSHSGGGGLASQKLHKRNGIDTDFPACGFWGANPRDALSTYVNTRMYLPEDEWWRTNTWIFGRNGECLGDSYNDPGNGCIECPDDSEWCAHLRGDIYWPNLHELNHGLTMSTDWPRWGEWFFSDNLCIDDSELMTYTGTCQPMYKTDHVVLLGETFESNKQGDWGRTLFKKFDLLLMQAVGWELRDTTMLTSMSITSDTLASGVVGRDYNDLIEVHGGIPGYQFTVTKGGLPPGLVLNEFNGVLTGQPAIAGSYVFTVQVLDADEYNVLRTNGIDQQFRILINE